MTDNKEFPYEAEVLGDHYAVFGPTVLGRNEKGSQFYIGGFRKCASLSEALNLAYAAGVKAERERAAKIVDPAPGSVILCCSVDCGTKIAEILKKKAEAIREEPA